MKSFNRYGLWVLFIISPIISAYLALKHNKNKVSKNILWAFIIFYGFTFSISGESSGSDITRYVAELKSLHGKTFTFSEAIDYFKGTGEIDILRTIISITVSRFTNSQIALTTVYAFIFGFFYSRNLFFIIENINGKCSTSRVFVVIVFRLFIAFMMISCQVHWYIYSFASL